MKKSLLVLAGLAVILASCAKKEDVSNLQAQIDELKPDKIASIEGQIASINTSIKSLEDMDKELKGYIETLQTTAGNLQKAIEENDKKIDKVKEDLTKEMSTAKSELLGSLESLRSYMKGELATINTTILSLQQKDVEIDGKIVDLKLYVNEELKKTQDWATGTFATLKQFNDLSGEVSAIKADIVLVKESITSLETRLTDKINKDISDATASLDAQIKQSVKDVTDAYTKAISDAKTEITEAYEKAIANAVSALEASMKSWINEQLSAYHTAGEMDVKIAALQSEIDVLKADDETNKTKIVGLEAEIGQLSQDLETAKATITAEYEAAIARAITEFGGTITQAIQTRIAEVNTSIADLASRVNTLEGAVASLQADVDTIKEQLADILARIQSINVVPTYSDGSVKINDEGLTEICFEILPREASAALAKKSLKYFAVSAVTTETKASIFTDIPVKSISDNGECFVVTVDGTNLSQSFFKGESGLSARLKIDDGNNSLGSPFFVLSTGKLTPGITITSEKYVALSEEGTAHITFRSSAVWTAEVVYENERDDYVQLSAKAGEAGGECKITILAEGLPYKAKGRTFSVKIVPIDGSSDATVYFGQGKFFTAVPETPITVGIEGGKVSYHIFTNCTSYDVKKYDGPEDAFHFAPVTWDKATMTVTMDFQPNTFYNEREAYVKFFDINEIADDYVVKTYGYQDAVPCKVYSISMADAHVDLANVSVLSEAIYNGKHYLSTGKDLYRINPATGGYEKIDWPWGNGMTQRVITNDDAGNLIVCNHTAYTDAYLDGNFKLNVVTPAGVETNLIDKAAWECGGPAGAKIKVTGDVTGNAMICLPVEGIEGIGISNTLGYWQVTGGIVGEYASINVDGFVGPTWGAGYWHTYANWLPNVVAVGTTPEGGFVMSGVYDENCLYDVAKDGAATKKMTATYICGTDDCTANFALQSIDIRTIGGVKYLVVLASPQFPSFGWEGSSFPIVALHKVSNIKSDSDVFTTASFTKVFPTDGATDIMPAGEVSLYDNGGQVGILFSDLNGGCVTAVSLDPATL